MTSHHDVYAIRYRNREGYSGLDMYYGPTSMEAIATGQLTDAVTFASQELAYKCAFIHPLLDTGHRLAEVVRLEPKPPAKPVYRVVPIV